MINGVLSVQPLIVLPNANQATSQKQDIRRAQNKVHTFISKMPIVLSNPMLDHLLESSHRDDSNNCSIIGFAAEII